jgi:hypothetical protein
MLKISRLDVQYIKCTGWVSEQSPGSRPGSKPFWMQLGLWICFEGDSRNYFKKQYSKCFTEASNNILLDFLNKKTQKNLKLSANILLQVFKLNIQLVSCPKMEFLNGFFLSRFLGLNSNLLRLEFLSGFLPSSHYTKCYLWIDSSFLVSWIFRNDF